MENLKLIVLPNNEILLSEIEEVPSELGEPDCKLVNPFIVKKSKMVETDFILEPWLNEYTSQNTYMIHSDKILTISDPISELVDKYKKINS